MTASPCCVRATNVLRQRKGGELLLRDLLAYVIGNESRFAPGRVLDPATGSGVVDEQIRRVLTLNDLGRFERVLADEVRRHLPMAFARLGLRRLVHPKIEMQLTASTEGAHFSRHRDTHRTGTRVVSFVYYFNRSPRRFSGGELRLFADPAADDPRGTRAIIASVSPRHDSMIFFPSLTEHEVLRVAVPTRSFADSRFTITGWVGRRR